MGHPTYGCLAMYGPPAEIDLDGEDGGGVGGVSGSERGVGRDHGMLEGVLALVEADMEVAEVAAGEAGGAAAASVGLDVAADLDWCVGAGHAWLLMFGRLGPPLPPVGVFWVEVYGMIGVSWHDSR